MIINYLNVQNRCKVTHKEVVKCSSNTINNNNSKHFDNNLVYVLCRKLIIYTFVNTLPYKIWRKKYIFLFTAKI